MLAQKKIVPARGRAAPFSRPSRLVAARAAATSTPFKLPKWEIIYDYLTQNINLKSIQPEEAQTLVSSGKWVLVDVRPPSYYKESHPEGSVNVPLYQPLDFSKADLGKVVKLVFYGLNGVKPIEPNPDFLDQLKAATAGGKGVITICDAGGTLRPTTNFQAGKPSRSLQAIYRAVAEGVVSGSQVLHVDRGVYGWYQADLPFVGEGEYKPDIGRTPMAAADPMLKQTIASTGYEMRPDDKK